MHSFFSEYAWAGYRRIRLHYMAKLPATQTGTFQRSPLQGWRRRSCAGPRETGHPASVSGWLGFNYLPDDLRRVDQTDGAAD